MPVTDVVFLIHACCGKGKTNISYCRVTGSSSTA